MEIKESSFSIRSIYGVLFQCLSVVLFSLMITATRYLYKTTNFHPVEVLVWRSSSLAIFNIILLSSNSISIIDIDKKVCKSVVYRSVTGTIAVIAFFISNYIVPPSIVSAICKINPLLTSIIALFILNEKVTKIEVFGMISAFAGVLLIVFDPSKITFSISDYLSQLYLFAIPLFTAIMQSAAAVFIRIMGQSLHFFIAPTYLGISSTIVAFSLLLGIMSYREYVTEYTLWNFFMLGLVGFFGWAGQVTGSKALQLEKAGRIGAINFDTVLLLMIDVFYFGEDITYMEMIGIVLIMITVLGIAVLKAFQIIK